MKMKFVDQIFWMPNQCTNIHETGLEVFLDRGALTHLEKEAKMEFAHDMQQRRQYWFNASMNFLYKVKILM